MRREQVTAGHGWVAAALRGAPGRRRIKPMLGSGAGRRTALLFCTALLMAAASTIGCAAARARRAARDATPERLPPGDYTIRLRYDRIDRSYIVHVPPGLASSAPVLLAYHGGGGSAAQFRASAGIDAVADRERFIAVYPNGTSRRRDRLLTWNAGDGCCGFAVNQQIDDIGFTAALIEDLARRINIDRRRLYATGHSNGGIFVHRLAAERADLVVAVASVAGSLDISRFNPSRAVALLQIHSVDDPRALYQGGLGPPFPGTNSRVLHQSAQLGLNRWLFVNSCRAVPDTVLRKTGASGSRDAGHSALLIVWRPCMGGVEVAHWKLTGAGHGWPGAAPGALERLTGPQTTIIRAADEVWAFVSRFSR